MEAQAARTFVPFEFTGSAGEYFKIWIVNIVLSILTLGIYSAWAKVRNKRYFYGNTVLEAASFEYHGKPIAILKGRIIAVVAILLYSAAGKFYPLAQPLLLIPFAIAFPWLLARSLKFNAFNSSYRNLRFSFTGTYWGALKAFISLPALVFVLFGVFVALMAWRTGTAWRADAWLFALPVLLLLLLGLMFPYWDYLRRRYIVGHHRYGTAPFEFTVRPSIFYKIYLIAFGIFVLLAFLLTASVGGVAVAVFRGPQTPGAAGFLAIFLIYAAGLTMYLGIFAYIQAAITNVVFNGTSLAEHGFRSTLSTFPMIWIYLSNAIVIVLTLGLLIPWARVRMVRYRLQNLKLLAAADLSGFVAATQAGVSATGEELADMLDFDIAW